MSKKLRMIIVALFAVLCCGFGAIGCKEDDPNKLPSEDTPYAVAITLSGMQTEFEVGDMFSVGQLVVTVLLSNGDVRVAEANEYECDSSDFNANVEGEYTITIKLKDGGICKTYRVTVTESDDGEKPVHSWDDDGALKILMIGNSFSDDTMEYAYQIARSLGIEDVFLGTLYMGGCSLDMHYGNAIYDNANYEYRTNSDGSWKTVPNYKMSTALASCDWDFVSLQQASGSSGLPDTYSNLSNLINYVKSNLPETSHAKIVWNMTWAYQSNSTHSDFVKYNRDQMRMYTAIVETVKSKVLTNRDVSAVISTSTAVQNARSSYLGDTLTRDGHHLSLDFGRYVAGLTLIHALTGLPIDDISYAPPYVDANRAVIAIESATNAVLSPYAVTQSRYTEIDEEIDLTNHTELEYDLALGYWCSTLSNAYDTRITTDNLAQNFYSTKRFTRNDLPVGSIVMIESGWQYRPEAWKNNAVQSSRPDNVTAPVFVITEEWWDGYIFRAFNVSKIGLSVIAGEEGAVKEAFRIYIPVTNNIT